MSDEATPKIEQAAQPPNRPLKLTARRHLWRRLARRYTKRTIIIGMALAAAAIVSFATVDLGPTLKAQAEQALAAQIKRPVHIGNLGTYFLPGRFLIEDLVIDGLEPGDRPFFFSDRIVLSASWLALLRGEVLIDTVDMGNWRMLVELFEDGQHNFPRFLFGDEADIEKLDEHREGNDETRHFVTTVQYLRATDGEFTYEDHATPWSVMASNVDLIITKLTDYGGRVSFSNGTVQIGSFEEMKADMEATYTLDGGLVDLARIDLMMNGFTSVLTGDVDLLNWPEQTYRIVESEIDLPKMKAIFFSDDDFTVTGEAQFTGTWHLFDGGRELTGSFQSDNATLNTLAFPRLDGSLIWTRDRFEVTDLTSGFYGGNLQLDYGMQPLGAPEPGAHTFDVEYTNVEITELFEAIKVEGVRPDGRASGATHLRWPIGTKERQFEGNGQIRITPPPGTERLARGDVRRRRPFTPYMEFSFTQADRLWNFPIGGELTFDVSPEWIDLAPGHLATPLTTVSFEGRTAYGERSHIPFHVTSINWQESDRLLAAILTAFGNETREIAVGGRGELDGVMLGAFTTPRIEARFEGDQITAWNVSWGSGTGDITVENSYLDVVDGLFENDLAQLEVDGRFALGFPQRGGREEINARFGIATFPAERVRRMFDLRGYEINGPLTGEVRLYGQYHRPFGVGRMTLTSVVAYGEPFDSVTAGLRFEGEGVRIEGLEAQKSRGTVTGAAFIRWNGTYSFNADGRNLALGTIDAVTDPRVPVEGRLQFIVSGVGAFENPRYELRGSIADLVVSGEVVGQVTGRADVRSGVLLLEVEAASSRLAASGSGRVELTAAADADLLFRFTNTTLDPYVRAFQPDLPAGTAAIISGTLHAKGPVRNVEKLVVEVAIEQLNLTLFDYAVRNAGPVQLVLDRNVLRIDRMQLAGEGTALELTGQVGLSDGQVSLRATGDASLGILQGFFPNIRGSGNAQLEANITGSFRAPVITGAAAVDGGRLRHLSLPHSIENINGRVVFEPGGVRFDYLVGELGEGPLRFGGRLVLRGYKLGELNISAVGTEMRLRYPEGVRSLVDADLTLRGQMTDPVLTGTINVQDAVWLELFEPNTGLLNFAPGEVPPANQSVGTPIPLRFNVRIIAPSSLRISDNAARIILSAELILGGTFAQPLLFGNAEIEQGEVFFEGNRYRVTRGSIGFANPTQIEPFFDIEAETDVRVPGQTYRVTLGITGTMEQLEFDLSSDPPVQEFEILSMLLGDVRDPQRAELRALRAREASRQELFQAGAARLFTGPLSSGVGRLVEQSFGVDTFEITPALGDPSAQLSAQLLPTARLLIGKRISQRAHVTFSRALTGVTQDLIVVLEYDQSERLSWILSQNENRTYALDFRVRHSF